MNLTVISAVMDSKLVLTQKNNCPSFPQLSSLEVQQKDKDHALASLSPFGVPLHSLFSLLPNEPQQQINGQG